MRAVIRTLSRQGGQTVSTDRALQAERIRIGRGTGQEVEISDPRVPLAYAQILPSGRRAPYIVEALTDAGVWVNGSLRRESDLAPGDTLDAGRFRISILQPDLGTDLLLSVEEVLSAREQTQGLKAAYRTQLTEAGLSKRWLGWILFLAVLVGGLLSPLLLRYGAGPGAAPQAMAAFSDRAWQAGAIANAHAHFAADCGSCHEQPFQRVRNEACAECHGDRPHHSDSAQMLAMPEFAQERCASCHREHSGPQNLIVRHPALCTDCHAQPQARFAAADLPAAADFAGAHPGFSPRVTRYDAARRTFWQLQVRQSDEPPLEETNLIFPHDLHLAADGIDSPRGKTVLACADCHVEQPGGVSFLAVDMEQHCSQCHRLDFDPEEPAREVPHGRPAEVAAVIRDHYARKAMLGRTTERPIVIGTAERRRPGLAQTPRPAAPAGPVNLEWAEERAAIAIDNIFDRRTCGYCHIVERTSDPALPWDVAPLALEEHALSSARFSHAAHRTQTCESCHAARDSKTSADLLLPQLAQCRDCHGGAHAVQQVSSTCVLCHSFHTATTHTIVKGPAQGELP